MSVHDPIQPDVARRRALLLLGPTGSGKTPLGDQIEQQGLWDAPWLHFDFGANLRAAVEHLSEGGTAAPGCADSPGTAEGGCATQRTHDDEFVSADEIRFLREVLAGGALLEDERFPLARRILERFLAERKAGPETRIVLNGLPRHEGQADAIEAVLDVAWVVVLQCDADTVLARIAGNVGGDRRQRIDDDADSVRRKLAIYEARTAPLVEHYRRRGSIIIPVTIDATTTPQQAWSQVTAYPGT